MRCVSYRDECNNMYSEDTSKIYSAVSINLEKLEKVLTWPTKTKSLLLQELQSKMYHFVIKVIFLFFTDS